ncbi:Acg family FMN-binding oxidoreductase [Dactylosporangium matsuzakiense]|uniref:Nitroreductase n=1 Tax=Dactylosporangium matsuzakiense TaxID=53360 RepID=A0A9W6KSP3_9ACTN|nr:nitroreductase family protein [Dactylosporangium matsuzakiense]UWZ41400.1 nitroreductase family protein [Dactylosporangium matsuzakiense]GLL06502.1 nitroreductase [Dactylosporangium matsuzakiense]
MLVNDRPRRPLLEPGSMLGDCLSLTVMAPSLHNSQPWLFRLRQGGLDVYADVGRQLTVTDPTGREMWISVGAALFNLRVALAYRGRTPLLRLRPVPAAELLAARVSLGPPAPVSATVRALARAIHRRHSIRWPFDDLAVPNGILAELTAAAAAEGAVLRPAGPNLRTQVLAVTREAEQRWRPDPDYRRELAEWTFDVPDRRDGIPRLATGPRSANDALPLRDFGLLRPAAQRSSAKFEARPTIAVLYTGDSPRHWLQAGQALQRVLLSATARGLSSSLLTQPLEIPQLRDGLTDPASGRPAQAIVRLGYSRRIGAFTPRRPLHDVLLA